MSHFVTFSFLEGSFVNFFQNTMEIDYLNDSDSDSDDEDMFNFLFICSNNTCCSKNPVERTKRWHCQELSMEPIPFTPTCIATQNIQRLSEKCFRAQFRMSFRQFSRLSATVQDQMKNRTVKGGSPQIPAWIRLGVTLGYLGGLNWASLVSFFYVHNSFTSVILVDTLTAIVNSLNDYISFPFNDVHKAMSLAMKFKKRRCLPGTFCAMDGVKFEIERPKINDDIGDVRADAFYDYTKQYSLGMLAISGPDGEFLHCECKWAGSKHDAGCLAESNFLVDYHRSDVWKSGLFIVGDSAYALEHWLMV